MPNQRSDFRSPSRFDETWHKRYLHIQRVSVLNSQTLRGDTTH